MRMLDQSDIQAIQEHFTSALNDERFHFFVGPSDIFGHAIEVVNHDHLDHTADFESVIDLLYQCNKRGHRRR